MDAVISTFIADWMQKNTHVLEEIVLLHGDDPTTKYAQLFSTIWKPPPIGSRTTRECSKPQVNTAKLVSLTVT